MPKSKRQSTVSQRVETQRSETLSSDSNKPEQKVTKINFGGVKTTFTPIPNGDYECSLADVKKALVTGEDSKFKGAERLNLQFKVEEEGDWYNRRLFYGCLLVPEFYGMVKGAALALGDDPEVWEGEVDPEERLKALIADKTGYPRCIVRNKLREWDGQQRENVTTVKPLSEEATLSGVR